MFKSIDIGCYILFGQLTTYTFMIIPWWWTVQCFPQCKRHFKAGEGEKGEKETSESQRVEVTTGEKILQGQWPWLWVAEEKTEPTALKSPLSIVCARWWNLCFEFKVAVSTFLPWFILILLWLIDKYSLYERIHQVLSQCCPRYFLMVGQIIHGNKHDTLLEIKAGGAVDSYQIDTHTNLWYGQEAY